MDEKSFFMPIGFMFFHPCTCMSIFKWIILTLSNLAQKHFEVSSNQLPNLPPQTHHLKNPQWTLYLLQNSSQICPNSDLKKYLQHPHNTYPESALFASLNILLQNQKH
jgi:hypothetical protein